ncbi:hypothetical protein [Methanosphaera sp. WGK6]|nr:hypothetical protein [Methanosphaera sp. WGK6]
MTNKHPHNTIIKNMDDISYLITVLNDSKIAYVKKNLSIHLHEKELSLIR